MKMYPRSGEKRRFEQIDKEDEAAAIGSLVRLRDGSVEPPSLPPPPSSPTSGCPMENEKRIRREIANSNERRRMQSINAGFASLKQLLPNNEGEKLSKAAILQQTADYIFQLEQDRKELLSQNSHLKKILQQQESTDGSSSDGEGQMNDIHAIKEYEKKQMCTNTGLQNASDFQHKLNNISSENHNAGELIHASNEVCGKVTVLEEVSAPQEESVHYAAAEAQDFSHVKINLDSRKRHRASVDDSKSIIRFPSNKVKLEYNNGDDSIENESGRYSPVAFEQCEQINSVTVSSNTILANNNRCYTIDAHQQSHHPNTTIVTILPPTPPHPNSMPTIPLPAPINKVNKVGPSIVEVVSNNGGVVRHVVERTATGESCILVSPRVEVEPTSRIPTPDEIEYSAGESPPHPPLHHDGENFASSGMDNNKSGGQSCQKSLDTICEAIRHLEGDHMFSPNDDPNQINRIEEEIITEETYAIQDSSNLHDDSTYIHSSIVRRNKDGVFEICSPNGQQTIQNRLQFHPSAAMLYGIEEHLVSSEPQEAPLELTTTHRIERIETHSPPHSTISTQNNKFSSSGNFQPSRPGVIVVKQT